MAVNRGWNFLMMPGPTIVPDRVRSAMQKPLIEYAGKEFFDLSISCHEDLKKIFQTDAEVFVYGANGHGAWEAALTNTLSPGDKVLVPEAGRFSASWADMGQALGIDVELIPGDWRRAAQPAKVEERLRADTSHEIKAVLVVHTETATGTTTDIQAMRRAIDSAGHPALFMVDAIASLMTTDYRMDEWGVDVTVGACQKGLMLAPGMSFTAANERARKAGHNSTMPRRYWDWRERRGEVHYQWYCGTAPMGLVFGLREALDMIFEEGFEAIFARHRRLADAVHAAVDIWATAGAVEMNATESAERAASVSAILVNAPHDAKRVFDVGREHFGVGFGVGLGKLGDHSFRIGHMGFVNEPMVLGALGSVEAILEMCDIPAGQGGVTAAVKSLAAASR